MIENLFAGFVNLDHRKDRLVHMHGQLKRIGMDAKRFRGMLPSEYIGDEDKVAIMRRRSPGAIGCHMSQVKVMEAALSENKHAFVMEDDLVFCSDFHKRIEHMNNFIRNREWDVLWLNSTFHVNPPFWHTGKNPDLIVEKPLGRDAELTEDPYMIRTYGCFSTHAYIVNAGSIEKILNLLDQHIHESMGIDWLFIKLQPQLNTYAFVPGCVKQMDNRSDIGKGYTIYSGFAKLNGNLENSRYWWQDKMEQFDPSTFNWAECNVKTKV